GGGERHTTDLLSFVVAVAETNDTIVEGFEPAVGDRDPEHVTAEIFEGFIAAAGMLGMNDPANLPYGGRNEPEQVCLFQTGTKPGAEDGRQSGLRNEKAGMFGIDPALPAGRQTSGGDKHVDVRMKQHGARPGVKNGQNARTGAA